MAFRSAVLVSALAMSAPVAAATQAELDSLAETIVARLEILVQQGAQSLRIWTGVDPPLEIMRRAARN